jgi:hypothetical protein
VPGIGPATAIEEYFQPVLRHDARSHGEVCYGPQMSIIATIMNTATGRPIQKMTFGRMPKPWASFNLASGELVTADRVEVGKPAPGKFIAPVDIWVTVKATD